MYNDEARRVRLGEPRKMDGTIGNALGDKTGFCRLREWLARDIDDLQLRVASYDERRAEGGTDQIGERINAVLSDSVVAHVHLSEGRNVVKKGE